MIRWLETLGRMTRCVILLDDGREDCSWPEAVRVALAAVGLLALPLLAA
jgi:hypothetical protein